MSPPISYEGKKDDELAHSEPLSEETIQMALKGHRVSKIGRSLGWFVAIMAIMYVFGIAFGASTEVRGTYYLTLIVLFAGILFPALLLFLPMRKWTPKKLVGKNKKNASSSGLKGGAILLTVFWVGHLITLLAVQIKAVPEVILPVPIVFSVMGLLSIVGLFFAVAALNRPRREVLKYFFGTDETDGDSKLVVPYVKADNAEVRKHGSIAKTWKGILQLRKGFVYLCVGVGLAVCGTLTGIIGTEIYSDPFRASNLEFITNKTELAVVEKRLGTPTVKSKGTYLYCNDEYADAWRKYNALSAMGISENRPDNWAEQMEAAAKKLASIKTERLVIVFDDVPSSSSYDPNVKDRRTGDDSRRVQYVTMDAVARASIPTGDEEETEDERVVTKASFADSGNCLAAADYMYKRFYVTAYYKDGSYMYRPFTQKTLTNSGVDFNKAGTYEVSIGGLKVPFTVTDEYTYKTEKCEFSAKNNEDGTMTFTWISGEIEREFMYTHLGDDGKPITEDSAFLFYDYADMIVVKGDVKEIPDGTFGYCEHAIVERGVTFIGAKNFGYVDGSHEWDEDTPHYRDDDDDGPLDAYKSNNNFVPFTIYYTGTRAEWKADKVTIHSNNKVCFYSETQPTGNDNYWHYVDGVPTEW